jgi:transcriptional regulator with XRE-family HTH domain
MRFQENNLDLKLLGYRIKKQREKIGLRQRDIASALQISSQAVSKWERGENAPDISLILELSRLLGVTTEWLLGGTDPECDTFQAIIFCTSLNGYAKKSNSMPPKDVASWANNIYYNITESLLRHSGIPIKYLGDGFLGFFTGDRCAERAFKAALHTKKSLQLVDLVITLHAGQVFLGNIGHPDYALKDIIGEPVNTAFLAMHWVSQNCSSGIGVTENFIELFHQAKFSYTGSIDILGRGPVSIYEPKKNKNIF